ncbi:glycosyltransferase family 4 protein [Sabulicella glaciei]|uniref:Glycosyltransferase family 1 protein n=1 Tax=Sabulicella glaciei TaxID=2984948 RepID=A0ABT3NS01_9PROT|nr:glycosyltransferase family 1 protein [Roseococcus sp. MDT2-1-1]MCW8084354.1 glycosyltransferase family 1 protein [Roseococcus sp. MDT2-1-1]
MAASGEAPIRLLFISDAWRPQVNGVVRTLEAVAGSLREAGDAVEVIGPDRFRSLPMPFYPEIRLALRPGRDIPRMVEEAAPTHLHIATEGPLGLAARRLCLQRGWQFTTSFHTRFAEYVEARTRIPASLTWAWLRRFHRPAGATFAATATLREELTTRGFRHILAWTRGVDLALFRREGRRDAWDGLARPIWLHAGRVAVEKNIEAFLRLDLPGTKVVVGDGPRRPALQAAFPDAHFAGWRHGEALADAYRSADVLVFPSRTDTFGLVMLEAMACGTPVAGFPVMGPRDVVGEGGAVDEDLSRACHLALEVPREAALAVARRHSWEAAARMLRDGLVPMRV